MSMNFNTPDFANHTGGTGVYSLDDNLVDRPINLHFLCVYICSLFGSKLFSLSQQNFLHLAVCKISDNNVHCSNKNKKNQNYVVTDKYYLCIAYSYY